MGRKSTRENKTIYQKLREENDLTREKAAELLEFISEDRLERIENEKSEPAPEDVIRMAEVYKAPELPRMSHRPEIRSTDRDDGASRDHSGDRGLLKCRLPSDQPAHRDLPGRTDL